MLEFPKYYISITCTVHVSFRVQASKRMSTIHNSKLMTMPADRPARQPSLPPPFTTRPMRNRRPASTAPRKEVWRKGSARVSRVVDEQTEVDKARGSQNGVQQRFLSLSCNAHFRTDGPSSESDVEEIPRSPQRRSPTPTAQAPPALPSLPQIIVEHAPPNPFPCPPFPTHPGYSLHPHAQPNMYMPPMNSLPPSSNVMSYSSSSTTYHVPIQSSSTQHYYNHNPPIHSSYSLPPPRSLATRLSQLIADANGLAAAVEQSPVPLSADDIEALIDAQKALADILSTNFKRIRREGFGARV